jgi:hypothetical protein
MPVTDTGTPFPGCNDHPARRDSMKIPQWAPGVRVIPVSNGTLDVWQSGAENPATNALVELKGAQFAATNTLAELPQAAL